MNHVNEIRYPPSAQTPQQKAQYRKLLRGFLDEMNGVKVTRASIDCPVCGKLCDGRPGLTIHILMAHRD